MANFSALKTAIQNAIKQNGNEEITGDVLQQILLSIVSTMGDGAINTIEQNLSNEATTRQSADTQLNNLITGIKNNIDNGYLYAGIATPSATPVSGKVFYIATAAGTYTNFGGQVLTQGINILRYNGSAWSSQQVIGIDDAPMVGSNSLVKSGGVQNELALGAIYDVSAKNPTAGPNSDGKWESLSALLSDANLNTLIPAAYRKGGMSIKFVHTSDNKYVQYRLMCDTFNTNVANWQGVDEEPMPGSNNLVESGGIENYVTKNTVPVKNEIFGLDIVTTTTYNEEYVNNRGIIASGNKSTVLDIRRYRGKHLTRVGGYSYQYAFLVAYGNVGEEVKFCEGTGRVIGDISHTEVPDDAVYLYWYLGNTQQELDFPLFIVDEGLIESIPDKIENIEERIRTLNWNSIVDGKYINSSGNEVASSDMCYRIYPVIPCHYYRFGGRSVVKPFYILTFFDANGNFLGVGANSSTNNNIVNSRITVPENTAFIYMNIEKCCTDYFYLQENTYSTIKETKRIIYANKYLNTPSTGFNTLSAAISAIPSADRLGNMIVVYRDTSSKLHICAYSSTSEADVNWNNTNNWRELAFNEYVDKKIDSVNSVVCNYPLYFNREKQRYLTFESDNYIILSQDGDSLEIDVTPGVIEGNSGGYAFASGAVHSSKIALNITHKLINVRSDAGTWILGGTGVFKRRFTLKIEYADSKIKFYVDDELVNTYNSQENITISGFGYGNPSYGYWNGIIHNIKVNGIELDLRKAVFHGNLYDSYAPDMLCEKSVDIINIYRKYKDNTYIKYPIEHRIKEFTENEYPSYYDNWGLRVLGWYYWNGSSMTLLENLFRDGEAETAIRAITGQSGSTDNIYVSGSSHGFENISETTINGNQVRKVSLIVDNKVVGESDTFTLKEVKFVNLKYWSTMVQAYTNSNPFVDAIKEWIFDDCVRIKSSLTFTRDIVVTQIMQGMFCVLRHQLGESNRPYLTNKAIGGEAPYKTYTIEDGWENNTENQNLKNPNYTRTKVIEYGAPEIGFAMEITDDNKSDDGGMLVATNGSTYNKIYNEMHRVSETITAGTEYHSTQIWTIL